MAESIRQYDVITALNNDIDAKLEKIRKLENDDLDCLKTARHNLLIKSTAVEEIEVSLAIEVNLLCHAEAILRYENDTAWKLAVKMREELARIKSAMEESEERRVVELLLFEDEMCEEVPKYRDALILYSNDYLTEEIEEIRDGVQNVEDEIRNIVPEVETLVSKLNSTSRIEEAVIKLLEFEEIWIDSNSERVSARKQAECLNKELEEKIELNNRKIARLR